MRPWCGSHITKSRWILSRTRCGHIERSSGLWWSKVNGIQLCDITWRPWNPWTTRRRRNDVHFWTGLDWIFHVRLISTKGFPERPRISHFVWGENGLNSFIDCWNYWANNLDWRKCGRNRGECAQNHIMAFSACASADHIKQQLRCYKIMLLLAYFHLCRLVIDRILSSQE